MTSPAHPETYPRRILLAIGGMTPQVVTETLYYLCVKREPAYVPTDVYLITTQVGHDEAMEHLLDEATRNFNVWTMGCLVMHSSSYTIWEKSLAICCKG